MVHRSTLAIAASICLVLAGCGSSDSTAESDDSQSPSAASPEEPAATESEQEEISGDPSPEATESEDAAETEAEAETEDSDDNESQDTMESEKSSRGNLVKALGETATVATEGGEGDTLLEFAITDIETNAECSNEYADTPTNGNFIVVSVEATTMPELADQEYMTTWGFNPYDFHIIGDDGKRENDSTGTAYSCLSDSESLPFEVGPGQTVEGKIALDSAYEEGHLVYVPGAVGAGWEWEFGGEQ